MIKLRGERKQDERCNAIHVQHATRERCQMSRRPWAARPRGRSGRGMTMTWGSHMLNEVARPITHITMQGQQFKN